VEVKKEEKGQGKEGQSEGSVEKDEKKTSKEEAQ
jgi:hypothetical protein